jgi:hypothetical protein
MPDHRVFVTADILDAEFSPRPARSSSGMTSSRWF